MAKRLPVGATVDQALNDALTQMCTQLPTQMRQVLGKLRQASAYAEYDAALALTQRLAEPQLDALLRGTDHTRMATISFVARVLPERLGMVLGRLVHDRSPRIRRVAASWLRRATDEQRALWGADRWLPEDARRPVTRHRGDPDTQTRLGLPVIETVGGLREVLGIRSEAQLGFFLLATDAGDPAPYRCFELPKRTGGTRTIAAPIKQLKFVQREILEQILYQRPVHDAAHGFVPGRSTVTHAAVHSGRKVIVGFDLKDFFPSIHYGRVLGLFGSLGYHVGEARFSKRDDARNIAPVLARLCCHTPDPSEFAQGALPQGAPTSPAISNLVCRRLDARLTGLAAQMGGHYSRYADDLAFSFDALEDARIGRLRWWVTQICGQEGFELNAKKFRVSRCNQRQQVTGIVVNDCLRVPRRDRRRFRAILNNCRKHGIDSQRRDRPAFEAWLKGYAAYLHMVHPDEGRAALAEVDALLGAS